MDRRFDAEEWKELSNSERIERCNVMAKEAIKLADSAPARLAEGYLKLAEQWLRLGMEIGLVDKSSGAGNLDAAPRSPLSSNNR